MISADCNVHVRWGGVEGVNQIQLQRATTIVRLKLQFVQPGRQFRFDLLGAPFVPL